MFTVQGAPAPTREETATITNHFQWENRPSWSWPKPNSTGTYRPGNTNPAHQKATAACHKEEKRAGAVSKNKNFNGTLEF